MLEHLAGAGQAELAGYGGLSKATAGVLLRELLALGEQGADIFFGEPEFELDDLFATTRDGRGVVSVLELRDVQDRPALFSTVVMWLLARLYDELPEVGDLERPKIVFFFDEAHLLFRDASKAFLAKVEQVVRLVRSKGVGVFVEADGLVHRGQCVETHARVAEGARGVDGSRGERATRPRAAEGGADVEALHLGDAVAKVADGGAAGQLAAQPREEEAARGRRVGAREGGQLAVEVLEAEVEVEARRVLEEERARGLHVGRRPGLVDRERAAHGPLR